ncbi:hypothetical protein VFPPC_15359 [Pochonia chlamydosporia 170]|uniref:Uncharacterized protein n=1 Tax=Pochonia chlamydosporia 170 TaxID=1380566 RepID=A0A179G9D2_METCM|nr:hypothetical protein VFPPC_15359 [Pochonia chlamydosporia 170]OAQ73769.1 hypothetical protein VFPPC_15359 [Pochonia chlamydosporia 170]
MFGVAVDFCLWRGEVMVSEECILHSALWRQFELWNAVALSLFINLILSQGRDRAAQSMRNMCRPILVSLKGTNSAFERSRVIIREDSWFFRGRFLSEPC